MTSERLQDILQSSDKLSIHEITHILFELKNDCMDELYRLSTETHIPNIVKDEQAGVTTFRATLQNLGREQFYAGEANAFYICLDLLDKLEVRNG